MTVINSYNGNVNPYYYKNLNALAAKPAQSMTFDCIPITLSKDALFSCGSPQTGQTAAVYYDKSYTRDNPVMFVKGTNSDGSKYEEKINPKDVDPRNATYTELLALSTYLNSEGKLKGANPGINPSLCQFNDYFVKQDYIAPLKWLTECQWESRNLEGYTYYSNKLNILMEFCK